MSTNRYWLIVIALAVLVPATVATVDALQGDGEEIFCTAEGLIGRNGETHGRSSSQDCQYVDADGELLMRTRNGQPLCYGEFTQIVSCSEPDARRPG